MSEIPKTYHLEKPILIPFHLRNPEQKVPRGANKVHLYCSLETLDLPESVSELWVEDGGSLDVVPGVRMVMVKKGARVGHFSDKTRVVRVWCAVETLDIPKSADIALWLEFGADIRIAPGVRKIIVNNGADVARFSDGTVEIYDDRHNWAKIEEGAFEGVTTLRKYTGRKENSVWLPPTVIDVRAGRVDPLSLAACTKLRKLHLEHFDDCLVLPPSLVNVSVIKFHGGCIPPTLKKFAIDLPPDGPLTGDFSGMIRMRIFTEDWLWLLREGAHFPALRHLELDSVQKIDIAGSVFPEGVVIITIFNGIGTPVFPKSLRELTLYGCQDVDIAGVPVGATILMQR